MGPSSCGRGESFSEFIRVSVDGTKHRSTYHHHQFRTYEKSKNEKCPADSVDEAKGLVGFATVYISFLHQIGPSEM